MTGDVRRILVTGLNSVRDVVLALPRLAGLRAAEPQAQLTVRLPGAAIDLVQRLKLANNVWRQEAHNPFIWAWRAWRGGFSQTIDIGRQTSEKDLWAHVPMRLLRDDLAFLLPKEKFIVLAPPRRLPAVRLASFAKRLAVEGYALLLVGGEVDATWWQAFLKAAPQCRDLTGPIGLPEAVSLARHCDAWLGGGDAMTLLVALSGARTVILSEGEDPARDLLPAGQTTWVQSDDLSQLSIGDLMGAVLP